MPTEPDLLGTSGRPLFYKTQSLAPALMPQIRPGRGDCVRAVIRTVSGMQKEALVASARTGTVWRLASDEGAYLDGHDAAPCPLSFFTTGMICSYMNEIQALARQRQIRLRHVKLVQDNYYTMKGSALAGTMTGGARDVELQAIIDSAAPAAVLQALVCDAVVAAPINGLLRGVHDSLFSLAHDDREIAPARAKRIARPATPVPEQVFEAALPAAGVWADLVRRGGPSPDHAHTTTLTGGSLAEHQDRLLHVHATCEAGADGVKRIEQHLYNPKGSIFHFRSDEAPGNGGRGLAPDALTYIAAGIGFCFMTQLGRYAKILKKPLRSYRIEQDLHISPGGASGGTGAAGSADPIETHVDLHGGQSDDFARACLDMSEQTCFLHAFCRTDLKVRVRVAGPAAAS